MVAAVAAAAAPAANVGRPSGESAGAAGARASAALTLLEGKDEKGKNRPPSEFAHSHRIPHIKSHKTVIK